MIQPTLPPIRDCSTPVWNSSPLPPDPLRESDEAWMQRAIALAQDAISLGEVPVAALVVRNRQIIAQAFNLRETSNDPSAHAERLAIELAGRALGSWRLEECTLYVTLEPCPMCAGALVLARLPRLVFGAYDPKAGACGSLLDLAQHPLLNHRIDVLGGVLQTECGELLSNFFRARRSVKRYISSSDPIPCLNPPLLLANRS